MARYDVVISWGAIPRAVKAQLQRPTVEIPMPTPPGQAYKAQVAAFGWPHPLRGILQHHGHNPKDVLRIATFGFSETCQGPRALLASADAGYIETAFAFDGIHSYWDNSSGPADPGKPNAERSNVQPGAVGPWAAFAKLAADGAVAVGPLPPGERYCVITHNSTTPPYASTTDTAWWIMRGVFGQVFPRPERVPEGLLGVVHEPPVVLRGNAVNRYASTSYDRSLDYYAVGRNGLLVVGYQNADPTGVNDHIYQAEVVRPLVLRKLLVERWNAVDPEIRSCPGVSSAGWTSSARPDCPGYEPVKLPEDYEANPQDASLDWSKLGSAPPPAARSEESGSSIPSFLAGVGLGLAAWGGAWLYKNRRRLRWA